MWPLRAENCKEKPLSRKTSDKFFSAAMIFIKKTVLN
jgi:hypothetical protein